MSKIFSLIILVIFLITGLSLGVLNPQTVAFDAFLFQVDVPLSILLASTLIIGMLLGSVYTLSQVFKLRWTVNKQNKLNKQQAAEIIQLKKDKVSLQAQPENTSVLVTKQ